MVRVKTPFNPEQRVSQACGNVTRDAPRFVNAERDLVLELDPVAQVVIDVNERRFIRAFRRIAAADEERVYLPKLVSWSVRIIRSKWRSALCQGQRRKVNEGA